MRKLGRGSRRGIRLALATGFALACLVGRTAAVPWRDDETHDVSAFTTKADDISEIIHIVKYDPKELDKIGSDIQLLYSLRNVSLYYKQPDKIRLDAKSPTRGTALMIFNGSTRLVDVPRFKVHTSENLEKSPGKRLSLLEFGGLLSPATLRFMQGHFVRTDNLDGHSAEVYDLTYQGTTGGQSHRLWLDVKTHIILKREWYSSDKKLLATFTFLDPQEVAAGLWLPTRIEVKNADGVLAAVLSMDDMKINQGLDDSLFTIPS